MDSYQPIYDAVRSRIAHGDIGQAIESAIRDVNVAHYLEIVANNIQCAVANYERPSVLFRPKVFIDGASWCALYGDNLQDGVAGFGNSPADAMHDFDINWSKKL